MITTQVRDYAENLLKKRNIINNIYFQKLNNGNITLETFRKTQVQFYFAVDFFSRPMSALIARIPDPKSRLSILQNIVEEHGEMAEEKFHSHTFKKFLCSIGQEEENFS